ncbi:hypothetical protein Pfo_004016 [Paulownia fortunei]|nr:hypothetical protein Pfo_004016 [Paulownia fortunei]
MFRQPEVLWAQRSDKVYLTVSLPDAKDISVKCEAEGIFSFSAVGISGEPFNFTLQFYGNIAPQGCKTKIGLRNILCSIQKEQKGWWKRLLKSEEKPAPYIKVDWNKWCDEDDEESDIYAFIHEVVVLIKASVMELKDRLMMILIHVVYCSLWSRSCIQVYDWGMGILLLLLVGRLSKKPDEPPPNKIC